VLQLLNLSAGCNRELPYSIWTKTGAVRMDPCMSLDRSGY